MAPRKGSSKPCSRSYLNFRPYLGNGCLWPKADIETESKAPFLNVRFGEKSGRSLESEWRELRYQLGKLISYH